jgi:hypothetical protein
MFVLIDPLGIEPVAQPYIAFIAFYVVCCLVTWVVFMRERQGRLLGV